MMAFSAPWDVGDPEFGHACASYGSGGLEYTASGGLANLATGQEFTPQTRVNCGSIGKLITAFFATRIWRSRDERRRLRIDALLPGIPKPLGATTVEACLTHTTGLWDFRSLIPLYGERSTFAYGVSDAFELAVKQRDVVPGFERQYSNTNYLLLGTAVERAAGASLSDLVTDWLGSDVGNFVHHPRAVIPTRAYGYEVSDDGNIFEFGSFVDGRGSTNFWANSEELAALLVKVTDGFQDPPKYGGVELADGGFYAAGQDGGFRSGAVVDAVHKRCHVALTNDSTADPLTLIEAHTRFRVDRKSRVDRPDQSPPISTTEWEGTFVAASLGVVLSAVGDPSGVLEVRVGDRLLGRLAPDGPASFSDGHLDLVKSGDRFFLSINHARGIPLDRMKR